jgi:DNA-binding response OmpR family regulator
MDRILAVDDDVSLTEMLTEYLQPEGFALESAHDGESGVARILHGGYALVILDLMLPGLGGLEVLRRVRRQSQVPVILLTARQATTDRILGLEIGADDYLPKPFDPRELVARVRSVLRRSRPGGGASGEFLCVDDVTLDAGKREAHRKGEMLDLTSAEFDLLRALLASAGRPVARETLFQTVLEREFTAYDRSIDNLVSNLRRKLGPDPQHGERIKTIRNVGYIYAHSSTSSSEQRNAVVGKDEG